MVFFQIEIKISQNKNPIKSLLEAKIWFILSLKNNRRNIVFLRSAKVVNKEYILTYGYASSMLAVPTLQSKWKQVLDFTYIYKTFLGLLYTLRYIRSHLRRAWNIIYKFIYASLTYEKKSTVLYWNSRKIQSNICLFSLHVPLVSTWFWCDRNTAV